LDRGPAFQPACPRTCCACRRRVHTRLPSFLREPIEYNKNHPSGQTINPGQDDSRSKARTAQNIKHLPAQNAHEPLAAHRSFLLGFAIACSLRESLQGYQGLLPHLTQRTSITTCFPLPSTGQAHRPPGGSTSNLQLCKSSIRYPCMQATHHSCRCRLVATVQE
jgi:hypothetical protein